MQAREHPPAEVAVDRLGHAHDTDVEALTVQVRALGRAIEALSLAVEQLAVALPDGAPPGTAEQIEAAQWELDRLW